MTSITGRALHHVFKIGNRKATMDFYRNILGMKASCAILHQIVALSLSGEVLTYESREISKQLIYSTVKWR